MLSVDPHSSSKPPRRGGLASALAALLIGVPALALLAGLPARASAARTGSAANTDYGIMTSPLVEDLLTKRLPSVSAADGAFGPNARWEQRKSPHWSPTFQRVGENQVEYGLARRKRAYIDMGLKTFNWAFHRQAADGSFPGSASTLYGLGFFMAAVSRSSMLLEASPYAADYQTVLAGYRARIERLASYMASPAALAQGRQTDRFNTHRLYIVALAFALARTFTGDSQFQAYSNAQIRAALHRQWRNGVNPESGGYDSSYQALGLYEAEQWLMYDAGNPLASRVRRMIERGLHWESTRISASGRLNRRGDTRTHGQEISPYTQRAKTPSYVSIVRAFAYWAAQHRAPTYARLARRVAATHLPRTSG